MIYNADRTRIEPQMGGGKMRIRVAVCDDEKEVCNRAETMLYKIADEMGISIVIDVFYSGESLVEYLAKDYSFDFVLLDIELYELNGIDVGRYLRDEVGDFHTQIIFISSKDTYAMQLFSVQPLDFIVKPLEEKKLTTTLKRGLAMIGLPKEELLCCVNRTMENIPCSEILYLVSIGRKVRVICVNRQIEYYGRLSEEQRKLPRYFQQVHNSYIVNYRAVKRYLPSMFIMNNNDEIPISRKYIKDVKEQMMVQMRGLSDNE